MERVMFFQKSFLYCLRLYFFALKSYYCSLLSILKDDLLLIQRQIDNLFNLCMEKNNAYYQLLLMSIYINFIHKMNSVVLISFRCMYFRNIQLLFFSMYFSKNHHINHPFLSKFDYFHAKIQHFYHYRLLLLLYLHYSLILTFSYLLG